MYIIKCINIVNILKNAPAYIKTIFNDTLSRKVIWLNLWNDDTAIIRFLFSMWPILIDLSYVMFVSEG